MADNKADIFSKGAYNTAHSTFFFGGDVEAAKILSIKNDVGFYLEGFLRTLSNINKTSLNDVDKRQRLIRLAADYRIDPQYLLEL